MSTQDNGGWAFPCPEDEKHYRDYGMSLRDYFAAKAMQMHGAALYRVTTAGSPEAWGAMVSERAYKTADSMLKARES